MLKLKSNGSFTFTGIYVQEILLYIFKNLYDFFEGQSNYNTRYIDYNFPIHSLGSIYNCMKMFNILPMEIIDILDYIKVFK